MRCSDNGIDCRLIDLRSGRRWGFRFGRGVITIRGGGRYGVRIGGEMRSAGSGWWYGVIIPVEPENVGNVFREGNKAVLEDVLLAIQLEHKIIRDNQ